MAKLFGTDGVRGIVGQDMNRDFVFRLAFASGQVIKKDNPDSAVLIGRDTRSSGEMLENAVAAGLATAGVAVWLAGTMTTPGIAYLTPLLGAAAGIVISASHNPHQYNGIKILGPSGSKLPDKASSEIEQCFHALPETLCAPEKYSNNYTIINDATEKYANYLCSIAEGMFTDLNLILDCANGAAFEIAPQVFRSAGAKVKTIGVLPDGKNINQGCGSLHPALLQHAVVEDGADAGLAFDGDADRIIFVDAKGNVVDGDHVLAFMARDMKNRKRLPGNAVVGTTMSGLGLEIALHQEGCKLRAKVGDRYVFEMMEENGANLGGEPSGHIIFRDNAITGDGLLTGIEVLKVMTKTGEPLEKLASIMKHLPQVMMNLPLQDHRNWQKDHELTEFLGKMETELGDEGRLVVRSSGTEPLLRIMVEGLNQDKISEIAQQVADIFINRYGLR